MKVRFHNLMVLMLSLSISLFYACSGGTSTETETTEMEEAEATEVAMTEAEKRAEEEKVLFAKRGYADSVNQGIIPEDTFKSSPIREANAMIGNTEVTVRYGSPGMRGRIIWGGLVAYDEIWVTGAHYATAITFGSDVVINGQTIPGGKYAFYTIPGEETWTLILNENWEQHLADDYSQQEDVIRVDVASTTSDETVQRLTYEVESTGEGQGQVVMSWEKVQVALPFEVAE